MTPRIAVVFTGGTISMRGGPDGAAVPALGADDLVALLPDIDRQADLELVNWGLIPGSHLTFAQVLDIGRTLQRLLLRSDIDGAVVVQGTDNLEETAYAWDLLPLPSKPVVVVGAMRSASQGGFDGPDNLRDAIAAACTPELGDQGVVVSMSNAIHGADAVRKTHTHAYGTFRSVAAGALGTVADGRVRLDRSRRPVRLPVIPSTVPRVAFVTALLGETQVSLPPECAGLVVAGMGGGNTQTELLDLARDAMAAGLPVVLTTRCPDGSVRPGYGFRGGSSTWWEAGAMFAGWLDAWKSRVALGLGLGAGLDHVGLAQLFEAYVGGVRG